MPNRLGVPATRQMVPGLDLVLTLLSKVESFLLKLLILFILLIACVELISEFLISVQHLASVLAQLLIST